MLKKLIVGLSFLAVSSLAPQTTYAQYGQQVLGEQAPEEVVIYHEPKETGIAENLGVLAAGLLITSGILLVLAKRKNSAPSHLVE